MAYSYRLSKKEEPKKASYTREMLDHMPAYMLHDICVRERIMTGAAGVSVSKLRREELTELILRYRGEQIPCFSPVLCPNRMNLLRLLMGNGREMPAPGTEAPVQLSLYRGLPLTLLDSVQVTLSQQGIFSHVFLLDKAGEVCALFQLAHKGENTYLTMAKEWLDPKWLPGSYPFMEFLFVGGDTAFLLASAHNGEKAEDTLYGKELYYARRRLEKLVVLECLQEKAPLILDFGTSNTAAGYCNADGDAVFIRFRPQSSCDVCTDCGLCYLYPSAVTVKSCAADSDSGEDALKLVFGEDALREQQNGGLSFGTSIYDLKRFAGSYTEQVEVMDAVGNSKKTSKLELVRRYLLHVIHMAEERQKCRFVSICFTTPVKQKDSMLAMLKAALPEFQVEDFRDVDEGLAVLYQEFERLRLSGDLTDQEGQTLILDVGGGTSDLVCCRYRVRDEGISYRLDIDESYANGDTNFGGNNLTYRILTYIKIKLYYEEMKRDASSILPSDFFDPFNAVDDDGSSKKLYEELDTLYREAECCLPTRFADELLRSSERYLKIRSNYYTLWKAAEALKKQFFQDTLVSQISLPDSQWPEYSIFMQHSGELEEKQLRLTLSKEEVLTVITPDIYSLVKRFLEPLCDEDGILSGYTIKLSGQTCQIPVFREAVKEFTIGQRSRSRHTKKSWCSLKLKCIDGAVSAWKNREFGYMLPYVSRGCAVTPYEISAKNHTGREVILISYRTRLHDAYGYIARPFSTKESVFTFRSGGHDTGYEMMLPLSAESMVPVTYEQVLEQFSDTPLRQADLDTIAEQELRLFVMGEENKWGIEVIPIGRQKTQLYLGTAEFLPFDSTRWLVDFFDGHK